MSGILASFSRGGGALPELLLNITNTASPNIPTLLANAGWKGVRQPVRLLNTALVNTLVIPSSLAGADITIENRSNARIGGSRGYGTWAGGTALRTQAPIKIDNLGIISGGGGGGGDGGGLQVTYLGERQPGDPPLIVTNGGGAGGYGQGFIGDRGLTIGSATSGSSGEELNWMWYDGWAYTTSGAGGAGGSWGQSGDYGVGSSRDGRNVSFVSFSSPATSAGYYIDGNSLVTWINTGTRLGRVKA